jgi:hypothetical protein
MMVKIQWLYISTKTVPTADFLFITAKIQKTEIHYWHPPRNYKVRRLANFPVRPVSADMIMNLILT